MPIFYRGAGVGTYWHQNDARINGFASRNPGMNPSNSRLMQHIARSTVTSPYVSLTKSYGVAWEYAFLFGRARPTQANPAFVYEIDLLDPLPAGLQLLDPVQEVANNVPSPLSPNPYQHDGTKSYLLGVVDPVRMNQYLNQTIRQPYPGGTQRTPNLSIELETLVRALRDAEILAVGNIPASAVVNRIDVY